MAFDILPSCLAFVKKDRNADIFKTAVNRICLTPRLLTVTSMDPSVNENDRLSPVARDQRKTIMLYEGTVQDTIAP